MKIDFSGDKFGPNKSHFESIGLAHKKRGLKNETSFPKPNFELIILRCIYDL